MDGEILQVAWGLGLHRPDADEDGGELTDLNNQRPTWLDHASKKHGRYD